MALKYLIQNEAGDVTTDSKAVLSYGAMVICAGDFASITFEDNVDDNGWADVLDVNTGLPITITAPTNELALATQPNCSYALRATIVGGTDVTIGINEGVL